MNPATGDVLRELECAGEAMCSRRWSAQNGPAAWAELGVRRRIAISREFQAETVRKKSEIAAAITREAGKPLAEALITEVLVVLDAARFLIDNAWRLAARRAGSARQSGHQAEARMAGTRTARRDRNHLAVELSVLDSGDRNAGRAGRGQCRGAEAV